MFARKSFVKLTFLVLLAGAGRMWAAETAPVHERLLYEDNLQSAGQKPIGEIINGNIDKWSPGEFIAGKGWKVSNKFSQLRIKLPEYLPAEGSVEVEVTNFYPPGQLEENSESPISIWSRPESDMYALNNTPASFFYTKLEKKFVSGKTAAWMYRIHTGYYPNAAETDEPTGPEDFLTWDATATYKIRLAWTAQKIFLLVDGKIVASQEAPKGSFFRENFAYICLGNSTYAWNGMSGPIYKSLKIYTAATNMPFADVSKSAKIDDSPHVGVQSLAVADINSDGLQDFYTVYYDGAENRSNKLYVQQTDNTFAEEASVRGLGSAGSWSAAAFADIDGDGDMDLVQGSRTTAPLLYLNNNGSFTEVSAQRNISGVGRNAKAILPLDVENDGDVDFIVIDGDVAHEIYVNRGNGVFDLQDKGLGTVTGSVQGAVSGDLNGDSYTDVFITRRDLACGLFIYNPATGRYTDEASARGVALTARSNCPTVADYDNDGDLDILLGIRSTSSDRAPLNMIFENNGAGTFANSSTTANIKIDTYALYPGDLDNDGYLDLYALRTDHDAYESTSRIYLNNKNRSFTEKTGTGAELVYVDGRAGALLDYDGDGMLDILGIGKGAIETSSNMPYGRNALLKNMVVNSNNFLDVAVLDQNGHVNGLGSKIWVYAAGQYDQKAGLLGYRQVLPNQGYQSTVSYEQHFGLGGAALVDVKVQTPGGKVISRLGVQANQRIAVTPFNTKPQSMVMVKGDNQTGMANAVLSDSLIVRVLDTDGKNLSGQSVVFQVLQGSGTLNGSVAVQQISTDANGMARVAWKVGTVAGGENRVRASVTRDDAVAVAGSPIEFIASVTPGPASTMAKISGDGQQGYLNQTLALPMVVKVTDSFGNVTANQPVTFRVVLGGGTLNGTMANELQVMTDALGLAQCAWKLGATIGTQTVSVWSSFNSGSPYQFSATAQEPQGELLMVSGNYQTGTVNLPLSAPLVVKLQDFRQTPVSNVKVRFTVISGGGKFAGATTAEATTNSNGLASITPTLGTVMGDTNNVFHAIYEGANGSPVVFKASADAGSAYRMIEVSGNSQIGKVNRSLSRPFTVRVVDAYSNPVSGQQVDFVVAAGGGTLAGLTTRRVASDTAGYAFATLRLGVTVGVNTVTVAGSGLQGSPLTFTAEGQAGTPVKFFTVSGNRQRGVLGQPLPYPFVVALTDSFANPIANHPVQFTVSKGAGSFSGQGLVSVPTNALGQAAATLTMGATGYTNEVTVTTQYNSMPVGSPQIFTASTAATTPDSLVYVSGNYQIGRIGAPLPQPLKVMVVDANGIPVPNHTVTFLAVLSGASFSGKQTLDVNTDAEGIASATPTIGTAIGDDNNVFQARAYYNNSHLKNSPLVFLASGRRSTARQLNYVSGNNQSGTVGEYLPDSLRVSVVDGQGNPVSNHPVTFEVQQGNATINGTATTYQALSRGSGQAVVAVKLPVLPSTVRIRVSTDDGQTALTNSPLYFDATALVGQPSALTSSRSVVTPVTADGVQTSKISLLLKDAQNNPVSGKVVQIFTKGLDVQVHQPDAASDINGLAQGWLASARTGTVKVWTTVDGVMIPADTSVVTFVAGVPTEAVPFGSGQMVLRGSVLPMPLGLHLYDANGNPVPDVNVAFTILTGGGTLLEQQPVKTDAQGKASVHWKLGPQVDTQTLRAVVSGLTGNPLNYTAIAMPPNPGNIELLSGDRQIGVVNTTLADSFKVVVRDSTGKVAEGLPVYFHFTGQGQAMSPNPVRTDRRGVAAVLYRPGGSLLGEYQATATVPGLTQSVEFRFIVQNLPTIFLVKQDIPATSRPKQVVEPAVQVVDAYNRALAGRLVTFEVTEGAGSFQDALPVTTDENGFARIRWQLGVTAAQKVRASALNIHATPVTFATTAVNSKPQLTVPELKNALPGQYITATITAVDADGDAVTIKARNLPKGALFDSTSSRLFQWTPGSSQSGAYTVTFIATDQYAAADTATWRINVETLNQAPRITSFSPADTVVEAYYYETLAFSVSAMDPDNNKLTYFWKVNGGFAGNQTELVMKPEPENFAEDMYVQVEISDGSALAVARWHVHLSIKQTVQLSNLAVQATGRKAELAWQTSSERDNLGFTVLRSSSAQGPYQAMTETMIPPAADGRYVWTDESVQPGLSYYYKLRDLDRNGQSREHGPVSVQIALPEVLALAQNYPNPFNPTTTISFELPKAQTVELRIFNLNGQIVRTLVNGSFSAGVHQVVWDGRDQQGGQVTSGIYYYMMRAGEQVIMKKLLLAK